MFLNVQGNQQSRSGNVHVWGNPHVPSSQWRCTEVSPSMYTIENVNAAGMFVNVQGNKRSRRANVHVWDNPEETSTQWIISELISEATIAAATLGRSSKSCPPTVKRHNKIPAGHTGANTSSREEMEEEGGQQQSEGPPGSGPAAAAGA